MAKSIFQKIWDWLAGLGSYIMNLILNAFGNAAKEFVRKMGPQLEEIIKEVQADPSTIEDDDRRRAVFSRIKDAAIKAGFESLRDSVIYMAIEIVVQALKNTGELGPNVGAETKAKVRIKRKKSK